MFNEEWSRAHSLRHGFDTKFCSQDGAPGHNFPPDAAALGRLPQCGVTPLPDSPDSIRQWYTGPWPLPELCITSQKENMPSADLPASQLGNDKSIGGSSNNDQHNSARNDEDRNDNDNNNNRYDDDGVNLTTSPELVKSFTGLLFVYGRDRFDVLSVHESDAILRQMPALSALVNEWWKSDKYAMQETEFVFVAIKDETATDDIKYDSDVKFCNTRCVSEALFVTLVNIVPNLSSHDTTPGDFHKRIYQRAERMLISNNKKINKLAAQRNITDDLMVSAAAEAFECSIFLFKDDDVCETNNHSQLKQNQFVVIKCNNCWYGVRIFSNSKLTSSNHPNQSKKSFKSIKSRASSSSSSSSTLPPPPSSSSAAGVATTVLGKRTRSNSQVDTSSDEYWVDADTLIHQAVQYANDNNYSVARLQTELNKFQEKRRCKVVVSLLDFVDASGAFQAAKSDDLASLFGALISNSCFELSVKSSLVFGQFDTGKRQISKDRCFQTVTVLLKIAGLVPCNTTAEDLYYEFEQKGRMFAHTATPRVKFLKDDSSTEVVEFKEFFFQQGMVMKNRISEELISVKMTAVKPDPDEPSKLIRDTYKNARLLHDYFNNWLTFPVKVLFSDVVCWQILACVYNVDIVVYFESGEPPVSCLVNTPRARLELVRRTEANEHLMLGVVSNDFIMSDD